MNTHSHGLDLLPHLNVDIIQCWFRGQLLLISFCPAPLFTDNELDYDAWSTEGFTMTCPRGVVIGSAST